LRLTYFEARGASNRARPNRARRNLRTTEPRAMTHWRTRRKHRVSSERINNRAPLVCSKYRSATLRLPFDSLRLITLSLSLSLVFFFFLIIPRAIYLDTVSFSRTHARAHARGTSRCKFAIHVKHAFSIQDVRAYDDALNARH